jgi:hypothetical protein
MDKVTRITAMERTRAMAARTLAEALRELLEQPDTFSETELRDAWLERMRAEGDAYDDGWYTPPPHGIILLFATGADPARLQHVNYRAQETWSREDIMFDREDGLIYAYASPVDRATGIIGDFGVTLYWGKDQEVQEHLAGCLELDQAVAQGVAPDMKLSQVTQRCEELLKARGWRNTVLSLNDPTGVNIGHTIPAVAEGWSAEERAIIDGGSWEQAAKLISSGRLFMNLVEEARAEEVVAFTIEPRPSVDGRPDLPGTAYHTICVVESGQKRLVTNFDELFELVGMDYMNKNATSRRRNGGGRRADGGGGPGAAPISA